jgi:SAM-dependent methyltransferase
MDTLTSSDIRQAVREQYGKVAQSAAKSCCAPSCCSPESGKDGGPRETAQALGYTPEEITAVPEGSNLGLGCGNPQAIASLKAGETVLDLGSGAGFDAFLAARQVGNCGFVIGVDMTPDMVAKARGNAEKGDFQNVEFRLGEIEHLPVANNSVDVVISNCVINLSPEKEQVFKEAFRVLKPGGRLAISDIVATAELPKEVRHDLALYTGCVAGASLIEDLEQVLTDSGFTQIQIEPKDESRSFIRDWVPGGNIEDYVVSAGIEARKPDF